MLVLVKVVMFKLIEMILRHDDSVEDMFSPALSTAHYSLYETDSPYYCHFIVRLTRVIVKNLLRFNVYKLWKYKIRNDFLKRLKYFNDLVVFSGASLNNSSFMMVDGESRARAGST